MIPAAVPDDARCAAHPDAPAAWTCHRCGSFLCTACERRTRPDAVPLCPACWELRAQKVTELQSSSGTALQTTGLVLGIVSLVPVLSPILLAPLGLASLIINVVGIVQSSRPPARRGRWRSIVGLCLTLASVVLWLAVLFWLAG